MYSLKIGIESQVKQNCYYYCNYVVISLKKFHANNEEKYSPFIEICYIISALEAKHIFC